jgi:serine protease
MEAMRWAAGLHVDGVPDNPPANHAQVLNLSLGVSRQPCTQFEQSVVMEILTDGTVKAIVTAAGNDGGLAADSSPGSCFGTINVAGVLRDGNKAGASNYGPAVDLAAPYGEAGFSECTGTPDSIITLRNTGTTSANSSPAGDTTCKTGGTSFSAPLVSGVISLMLSINPNLTATQIIDTLQQTARAFPSGSNCPSLGCGAGTVDAAAALVMARDNPPPPRDISNGPIRGGGGGGGGCTAARRAPDWSLPLLLLVACAYAWRRRGKH